MLKFKNLGKKNTNIKTYTRSLLTIIYHIRLRINRLKTIRIKCNG